MYRYVVVASDRGESEWALPRFIPKSWTESLADSLVEAVSDTGSDGDSSIPPKLELQLLVPTLLPSFMQVTTLSSNAADDNVRTCQVVKLPLLLMLTQQDEVNTPSLSLSSFVWKHHREAFVSSSIDGQTVDFVVPVKRGFGADARAVRYCGKQQSNIYLALISLYLLLFALGISLKPYTFTRLYRYCRWPSSPVDVHGWGRLPEYSS